MIEYNVSLKSLNTFGIDAMAHSYALAQSTDDVIQILDKHGENPMLILGGGSNILLTQDFNGLVLKNDIQGFRIVEESESIFNISSHFFGFSFVLTLILSQLFSST